MTGRDKDSVKKRRFSSNEYFAFVDSIETNEYDRTYIQFDCIRTRQIEQFLDKTELTFEETESLKPIMVYCDYSSEEYRSFTTEIGEVRENTWVTIKFTSKRNQYRCLSFAQNYEDLRFPGSLRFFEKKGCNPIDKDIEKQLKTLFRIKETDSELKRIIRKKKLKYLSGQMPKIDTSKFDIAVYDVGQGNMNAILDDTGIPIVYFDLGGGSFWNAHTYPKSQTKMLCFKNDPIIILSHWDSDHWWTFNRLTRDNKISVNCKTTWIVPDQDLGPIQYSFYKLLKKNGHEILVCTTNVKCSFEFGIIEVGTGGSKNDSGIVLKAKIGSLKFLLPGDASYNPSDEQYTGIVATHHGGNCTDNLQDFPTPTIPDNGKIVYSFGVNNRYNHPSLSSVAKHGRVGWLNVKDTTKGSVSFLSKKTKKMPCNPSCNSKCDLDIDQVF